MAQDKDNVILFPTWKKNLEQDSLDAMREKKYEEALEKINQLLRFNVENHEIYTAKLICLMELRDHQGALELSEEMLDQKDENYFQYVHIYLTVLFQMGSYEELIDHVEYEFREHEVPNVLAEQFEKLEEASRSLFEEMKVQQGVTYITEFQQAVHKRAFQKQWNILMNIQKNGLQVHPHLIDLLASDDMHPMIQTAIFTCLQDQSYIQEVMVQKLGMEDSFIPAEVLSIEENQSVIKVEEMIADVEQNDPVLFQMMQQMIYRYAYVRYPFSLEQEHLPIIGEVVRQLTIDSLSGNEHTYENQTYKLVAEEIQMSISLYLSVAEE